MELGAGKIAEIIGDAAAIGDALAGGVEGVLETLDLDAVDGFMFGCAGVVGGDDFDFYIVMADEGLGEIGDEGGDGIAGVERVGCGDEEGASCGLRVASCELRRLHQGIYCASAGGLANDALHPTARRRSFTRTSSVFSPTTSV